ncbi:MAG: carboxypeptidase-like regulatory domain-containing protein [Paludibaculum sp.]
MTGEPLPGVQVLLRPLASVQAKSLNATSDPTGRIQFDDVKPGRYEFDSTKTGFVRHRQQIEVAAGSVKVDARLIPHARVSGRVTLGPDRPAAGGLPVEIRRRGGRPRFTTITAPNGTYLFNALEPGRYLLSAGGHSASLRKLAGYDPAKSPAQEGYPTTWAPTFFPDGSSPSEAQPINIKGGMDLAGHDLRLRQVPVYRLQGTSWTTAGNPPPVPPWNSSQQPWFGSEYETTTRADGSFELADVRPGDWDLRASVVRGGVTLKGSLRLAITNADLPSVRLELNAPFPLKGFVDREDPRNKEGKRIVSAVYMSSEDGGADIPLQFHQQDGSLRWDALYPGRYRIQPVGFLPGWYVDAVYVGDHEVLAHPVELRPGSPPVRIVYLPKAGRVRGTVNRGNGSYVYLLPEPEALWNDQFIRHSQADSEGRFEVDSLKPGGYIAFAFEERQEMDELFDPSLVRPLLVQGTRVSVRRGEGSEIELKPIPGGL